MTLTNPFFKGETEEPAPEATPVAALFPAETPDGDGAEPLAADAPAAEPEGIFPPEPSKKDADYSQNPAWKRIVKARDAAVLENAPLKQRIAELEPIAEAVRKRFEGRGDDPVAAMNWDASFADTFETLMASDPEVQSVARKVAAAMSGQTPTPTTTPAAKPAAAPLDERVELLLKDRAQEKVTGALKEMGIVERRLEPMAEYIVRHAANPARIEEAEITALGRQYVEKNRFTREELMGETNGKTPRRPASGGSRSASSDAAAAEPDEKPAAEFKDLKGYKAFKEQMIRKMTA